MKFTWIVPAACAAILCGCSTPYSISPVAAGSQEVRYDHGKPTTYSVMNHGVVQITPLGVNKDDRLGFEIAVFNKGTLPANFGTENLSVVQQDGTPGKVMTTVELEHEAEVKATWAKVAMVVAGGLDAYVAGRNSYRTTNATVRTPYGNASIHARTYDAAAAYQAGHDIGVETAAGIDSVQASLDETIHSIGQNVLQTTTVDPGMSTGGIAVVDSLSSSNFPQDIVLQVGWNGDSHLFHFTVARGEEAVVREAAHPAAAPTQVAAALAMPSSQPGTNAVPASQQTPTLTSYNAWSKQSGQQAKAGKRNGITIGGAAY